ncbi:MAG: YkgJ family cysteine cluster protein [Nitrososphaerota archaeon]
MGNDVFNSYINNAADDSCSPTYSKVHKYLTTCRRDEVLKLNLTFIPSTFTFECTKCGKCCYPAGLSLTAKEFQYFLKIISKRERFILTTNPPFLYKFQVGGRCPFLSENKLCIIYQNRPIVCVSFPLTFEYLPDGRLFVNLIRCEGIGVGDEIVDLNFVLKTIEEIKTREPNFFDDLLVNKLQQNPFVPFYTFNHYVSYDSKLNFNRYLSILLKDYAKNHRNLRTYLHSFIRSVRQAIENTLNLKRLKNVDRLLILDEDLEVLKDEIKSYFSQKFDENLKIINHFIEEAEAEAKKTGICEIYLNGKIKKLKINEYAKLNFDLNYESASKFQVSQVYFRKEFEPNAFETIIDYISEVMVRVGPGGFPIDMPISIMLDVLGEYTNNLEFRCNLYSGKSEVVTLKEAKKSIEDLDTNFALASIYSARARTFTF